MEERVMSVRLDPTAEEFTPTNHHRIPPHLSTPPPPQGILSLHFYCHLTHAIRTYPLFHPALPPHPTKFFHPSPISETLPLSSPPPPPPQRRRFSPRSSQPQLSHNKTTLNRGSPNNIPNSGSIASSMSSLTLTGEVKNRNGVEQQQHSNGPARKSFIRKHSCETTVGSTRQQQLLPRRNKKGKQAKKHETQFLIKEDAIVESGSTDSRTTLMIKNIPNKYSQKLLINMLDNHCIHCNEQISDGDDQPMSSYDFLYLPIDFNNKCNVGYGFVNMTSPEATLRLYKAFHLQHWEVFNSRKICEVTYARVQGLEALKEHFKNSKFPCEMEHYLPVVFSPPRDGRELTEPLPIVGNNNHQTIPN